MLKSTSRGIEQLGEPINLKGCDKRAILEIQGRAAHMPGLVKHNGVWRQGECYDVTRGMTIFSLDE